MKLEEELLYHNRRKKIYKIILENPGIHQRALEKKTKIPSGCLRYHILRLTKYGLIIKKCEKGYTRYFVANNIDNSDKLIIFSKLVFLSDFVPRNTPFENGLGNPSRLYLDI